MRYSLLALPLLAAGCAGQSFAPPVSTATPPNSYIETTRKELEPVNSLPLGSSTDSPLASRFGVLNAVPTAPLL